MIWAFGELDVSSSSEAISNTSRSYIIAEDSASGHGFCTSKLHASVSWLDPIWNRNTTRAPTAPRVMPERGREVTPRRSQERNRLIRVVFREGTMKKTGLFLAVVLLLPFVTALSAPSALARCGAFNLLEGDQ
jgi:hypothetical protein